MIPAALTTSDATAEWGVYSFSPEQKDHVFATYADRADAVTERDRIRHSDGGDPGALLMHADGAGRWTPETTHGGAL